MTYKSFFRNIVPPILFKIIDKVFSENKLRKPQLCETKIIKSYSQFNEDLIIDAILDSKNNGSYIDIGAFDPTDISNTKRFYDKGWTGINIDPIKSVIDNFNIERQRDINLNVGVTNSDNILKFYEFNKKYLSTFSEEQIPSILQKFPDAKIINSYEIKTMSLESVFLLADRKVDFLSIDAEGYEKEILTSNNWELYRPTLILIEVLNNQDFIYDFLILNNYKCVFNNDYNSIFMDKTM